MLFLSCHLLNTSSSMQRKGRVEELLSGRFIFIFYRICIVNNPHLLADVLMDGTHQTTTLM